MKKVVMALMLVIIIVINGGCIKHAETIETSGIIITTGDNVQLAATYKAPENTKKAVLLLHMLGHDRSDWNAMNEFLYNNNFAVLAIDFRGHGESALNYETFTDDEWYNLVFDVKAGIDFLEEQGFQDLTIIGASIGANAALRETAIDNRVDALVLLSAAEDYHGLTSLDVAQKITIPTFILASYADTDAAVAATKIFNAVNTSQKEIKIVNSGHGTEMLNQEIVIDIGYWLAYTQPH